MSYVFKNLDEIATFFEDRAALARKRGEDTEVTMADVVMTERAYERGMACGYELAADLLRRTTITEDVSCREI